MKTQRMDTPARGYAALYHQTDRAAADSILRSQTFRMGAKGFAGAGIYFATNPEDTQGKALHGGVILEAKVYTHRAEPEHQRLGQGAHPRKD